MDKDRDLTNFWQAWRKTCAIRACCSMESLGLHNRTCKTADDWIAESEMAGIVKDARWVIEKTNGYFAKMIRTPRKVKPLKKFADIMAAEGVEEPDDLVDGNAEVFENAETADSSQRPVIDDRRGDTSHIKGGPTLADTKENEDDAPPEVSGVITDKNVKRGKMISEYRDLVYGWDSHDFDVTSAFELVEIDLYREAAVGQSSEPSNPQEPMLNGKKLKDFLFEDIGGRPGGVCKNLWGYLLKEKASPWGVSRLRMVANQSFRNPVEEGSPNQDGPGELQDPNPESLADTIQVRQAGEVFRQYLAQKWLTEFDVTDRVAICCAFFQYVMSDPFVAKLVPVGMSAFNVRKTKRVREIFLLLKESGYDFDTVQMLFRERGQAILFAVAIKNEASRDLVCVNLVKHFDGDGKRWPEISRY